jgi:Skp family chaperone for outer membrane proteins
MKTHKIAFMLALVVAIGFTACTESGSSKTETIEITQMDSTAKQAKMAAERLEEQTKKVEESIEKMDEEFKTKN